MTAIGASGLPETRCRRHFRHDAYAARTFHEVEPATGHPWEVAT